MFQHSQNREDVRIKWEKNSHHIWWRLNYITCSKLKPKGERALVLKAWATSSNQQEILAIRFRHQQVTIQFANIYHTLFPMTVSASSPNISQQTQHFASSTHHQPKHVHQNEIHSKP